MVASVAKVVGALVLVQGALAVYVVLTKTALNGDLDAGVFVLLRDAIAAAVHSLALESAVRRPSQPLARRPISDSDVVRFWLLGLLGLYFGQLCKVLGLRYGSAVLSATWDNTVPAATYLLGLLLGTERFRLRDRASVLRLLGVGLAVGGAVGAATGGGSGGSGGGGGSAGGTALACTYFALAMLLGNAAFWHLQKRLLARYAPEQVVCWYYQYGWIVLALVVLPNATSSAQWRLNRADGVALCSGVLLWPAVARLMAFANDRANAVAVMAFAPLQIVFVTALGYSRDGALPGRAEIVGAAVVVVGLGAFVAAMCVETGAQGRGGANSRPAGKPSARADGGGGGSAGSSAVAVAVPAPVSTVAATAVLAEAATEPLLTSARS